MDWPDSTEWENLIYTYKATRPTSEGNKSSAILRHPWTVHRRHTSPHTAAESPIAGKTVMHSRKFLRNVFVLVISFCPSSSQCFTSLSAASWPLPILSPGSSPTEHITSCYQFDFFDILTAQIILHMACEETEGELRSWHWVGSYMFLFYSITNTHLTHPLHHKP